MYGEQNEKKLKPSIPNQDVVEKMAENFFAMNPEDAVEAFKYLQKIICSERFRINDCMKVDLQRLEKEIEIHRQGTDAIASGL